MLKTTIAVLVFAILTSCTKENQSSPIESQQAKAEASRRPCPPCAFGSIFVSHKVLREKNGKDGGWIVLSKAQNANTGVDSVYFTHAELFQIANSHQNGVVIDFKADGNGGFESFIDVMEYGKPCPIYCGHK